MKIIEKTINNAPQTFLYATDGMIVTDGNATYGTVIRLAKDLDPMSFYEITWAEYEKLMQAKEDNI
jgi:hypothetical protein